MNETIEKAESFELINTSEELTTVTKKPTRSSGRSKREVGDWINKTF